MSLSGNNDSGFTLVEMLCACSILGLILTLALPNMNQLIERTKSQELSHQVIAQFQQARWKAMAKESETFVTLTDHKLVTVQAGQVIYKTDLPIGLHVTSNYPRNEICFEPTGQVRGGTILFHQQGKIMLRLIIQVASGLPEVNMP